VHRPGPTDAAGLRVVGGNGESGRTVLGGTGRDRDVVTVVDRSPEAPLEPPLGEEVDAPCLCERMGRVGEDVDARHERTAEAELLRH